MDETLHSLNLRLAVTSDTHQRLRDSARRNYRDTKQQAAWLMQEVLTGNIGRLDTAWAELLAAIPEGHSLRIGRTPKGDVTIWVQYGGRSTRQMGTGPDLATAAQAITARLRNE